MSSSTRVCSVVTEFLSTMDHDAPNGAKGHKMMIQKLRLYFGRNRDSPSGSMTTSCILRSRRSWGTLMMVINRMLTEDQPKFIVMFEPNMEFIRRIEVCVLIPGALCSLWNSNLHVIAGA